MTLPASIADFYTRAWERPDFRVQSSAQLHSDLYEYILANRDRGHGIIEVGVYRGGCSLTLAAAAAELKMPFYIIDIDEFNRDFTGRMIAEMKILDEVVSCRGTLTEFALKYPLRRPPLLVFIDGDHDYSSVLCDIKAAYAMKHRPYSLAFHDFSLRSTVLKDTGVDKAIYAAFGNDVRYTRVGEQFGPDHVPNEQNPAANGCWWLPNGTEAVVIETGDYPYLRI